MSGWTAIDLDEIIMDGAAMFKLFLIERDTQFYLPKLERADKVTRAMTPKALREFTGDVEVDNYGRG